MSSGDKILSENYFQHADHFTRILNEQESFKKAKYPSNVEENKDLNNINKTEEDIKMVEPKSEIVDSKEEAEVKATVTK